MVKDCGGRPALDSLLFGYCIVVRYCVAEESQFPISFELDTVGLVLVGYHWSTFENRTPILMTPKLRELRIKELTRGLDTIKGHMVAGNLGRACELLQQTFQELKLLGRQERKR
jgi:hypothetical protein